MAEGPGGRRAKLRLVASYEVSRTLVKSPPELWAELEGERLREAVGGDVKVKTRERERELRWEGGGATGVARLEPSSWGTKVTLTAEIEEQVAEAGVWQRLLGRKPAPPVGNGLAERLTGLLDSLGSAHRKPFVRE